LLLTALLFSADTAAIGIPDPIRHDGGWLEPEHRRGGGGGVDDPPGSPAGPQSHGRDGGQSVTEPGQAPKLTLYGYDNAANRTGKTVSENGVVSTATTYTFNPANQLVGWTERNGEGTTLRSATLTFDTRGNRSGQTITQPGAPAKTTSYSWDYQNRLVGVTDPQGGQHAYAYDYRTRRIARSEPGGATAVTWSGGLSLAEYPVTGLQGTVADPEDPTVEYRRGPDMGGGIGGLLHSLRNGTPKYNLGNGRGDVVAQSDATGALTWTASYEAFGTRPVETGSNADRQRANTKEEDPTELLWEHFRYRDLETGVWLSRDPAGFVDGPNLYAYVRQNPWTMFDPLGLESESEKHWKAEGKRSDVGTAYKMYAGFRHVGAALNPFSSESSLRDTNRKFGEGVAQAADEINKSPIPAPLKGVAKFGLGVGSAGHSLNPLNTTTGLAETTKQVQERGVVEVATTAVKNLADNAVENPSMVAGQLLVAGAATKALAGDKIQVHTKGKEGTRLLVGNPEGTQLSLNAYSNNAKIAPVVPGVGFNVLEKGSRVWGLELHKFNGKANAGPMVRPHRHAGDTKSQISKHRHLFSDETY
jgi:RHS repeat-associated protein